MPRKIDETGKVRVHRIQRSDGKYLQGWRKNKNHVWTDDIYEAEQWSNPTTPAARASKHGLVGVTVVEGPCTWVTP